MVTNIKLVSHWIVSAVTETSKPSAQGDNVLADRIMVCNNIYIYIYICIHIYCYQQEQIKSTIMGNWQHQWGQIPSFSEPHLGNCTPSQFNIKCLLDLSAKILPDCRINPTFRRYPMTEVKGPSSGPKASQSMKSCPKNEKRKWRMVTGPSGNIPIVLTSPPPCCHCSHLLSAIPRIPAANSHQHAKSFGRLLYEHYPLGWRHYHLRSHQGGPAAMALPVEYSHACALNQKSFTGCEGLCSLELSVQVRSGLFNPFQSNRFLQ